MASLQYLSLQENDLTGPIPDELGSLASLQYLSLQENDLTGPIPDELGSLAKLERLNVSYNWGLTGPWSPGLPLSQLKTLDIFVTRACVPAAWGDWLETIEFLGQVCGSGTDVTIDVAVFHTASAREGAGGAVAIGAEIDLMVAEANQAFAASGVHHRLRLVARSEVAYRETGDSRVDLQRFVDPSDGYMDEVHVVRDRVGADLVHLIVDAGNAGGLAATGEFSGLSCQTCGGGVFTHEVGHSLGLWHDRYQAHHHEGGVSSHPAYGYVNQRAFAAGVPQSRRWRTIMSYETQCVDADVDCLASGLLRFSNPRQSYNGDPLGIPFGEGSGVTGPADAAAVLNTTGPAVALRRARPPARPPVSVSSLPDWSLTPGGMLTVDVSGAFVDPDGDLLTYTVSSTAPQAVTGMSMATRVMLSAVGEGAATVRVTATDPDGLSAAQSFTVTVALRAPFTDDPIVAGVTPVRLVHFIELRTRIDVLRTAAGLARFRWTDPVLPPGVTPVRRAHLLELRTALAEAYAAAGRVAQRWTDAELEAGTTPILATHLTELRAAVLALE